MKNLFERPKSNTYETTFLPEMSRMLNIDNLKDFNRKKVIALYKPKFAKDFLAYRFSLLNEWIKTNKQYTKDFVIALDSMVNTLVLNNELNSFEQQYIKNLQAIVFAKNRNLKQLIVDFSINKGEFVFYRYDLDAFKLIGTKGLIQIIENPEMYITTQRIIISKQIDIISITYESIKTYDYKDDKFSFQLKDGKQFFIDSDNNMAIFESLNRVLKKEKIDLK